MGQQCSTESENICTLDNYEMIRNKCKRLKDKSGDKVGTMTFIDDFGKDMKKEITYDEIYRDRKRVICAMVNHTSGKCSDGHLRITSNCEGIPTLTGNSNTNLTGGNSGLSERLESS